MRLRELSSTKIDNISENYIISVFRMYLSNLDI